MHNYQLGRFTTPDSFTNDTRISDPQSWNLYLYVRNNPLNMVDPLGKKGRIRWWRDTETGTINVRLEASFAVYGAKGQNVSTADLEKYKNLLIKGVQKHLEKTFNISGKNFNVTTLVTAKVVGSEAEAIKSGADNIVDLGYNEIDSQKEKSEYGTAGVGFGVTGENFDRMAVQVAKTIVGRFGGADNKTDEAVMNTFAHEFAAHLLSGLHNGNKREANSLFYKNGGTGEFLESDFKRLVGVGIYNPPPPSSDGTIKPITGGLIERMANSRNNASPSDVYKWKKGVAR